MKHKDESVVDFLQRATWFEALQRFSQKHSEMMQPWNTDYPNMEYGYPNLNGPPNATPPGTTTDGQLYPQQGVCVISCFAPLYCDDDVECHFSISQTPTGMDPHEAPAHWQMEARETNLSFTNPDDDLHGKLVDGSRLSIVSHQTESDIDTIISKTNAGTPRGDLVEHRRTATSSIFPLRIAPPAGGWPHWPEHQPTMLYVRAMDAAGNICHTQLSVFCREEDCCQKPDYVAMTFDDDSTPNTIAPDSNITVFVLNGCGPYNWSVTGTGFSFTVPQTSGPSNTLNATAGACGPAHITVTDSCNSSVNFYILCTVGDWCRIGDTIPRCTVSGSVCQSCFLFWCNTIGCANVCGSLGINENVEYSGKYKWKWTHECICTAAYTPHHCKAGVIVDNTEWPPPSCPTPMSCVSTDDCCIGDSRIQCVGGSSEKYEWKCTC
jgi:hypothetical protein